VSSGLPSYDDLRTAVTRAVRAQPPSEPTDELPRLAQLLAMADAPEGPGRIQVLGDLLLTDTGPEVPHQVAQAVLASGDPVLTVNWDDLVERECARIGTEFHLIRPGEEPSCGCGVGHLYKLHGEPHRLDPSSGTFDRMPVEWVPVIQSLLAGRDVAVFGHSARDVDIRPALFAGLEAAKSCTWFCLPADKSELTKSLGSLAAGSQVIVHGSVESFPLLLAWGSAHGLNLTAYERPQPDYLSAATLITPRMMSLVEIIARRPLDLQVMDDRAFEELVAALLQREGYDVELTQPSKDGGVDIHVRGVDPVSRGSYYLLQCKRVGPGRKIGPAPLRELHGLVSGTSGATKGIVVTSGFFTRGAKSFQSENQWRLALHDYDSLTRWIERVQGLGDSE
jgi:hypothetical protein